MSMDSSSTASSPDRGYQSDVNTFDSNELEERTDNSSNIPHQIEHVYDDCLRENPIRTGHRINGMHQPRNRIIDYLMQLFFQRRSRVNNNQTVDNTSNFDATSRRKDRLCFPLELDNVTEDSHYQGSRFVMDWFLKVFPNPSDVKFNHYFKPLIEGIQKEGEINMEPRLKQMIDRLLKVANDESIRSNSKRIRALREVCITLYADETFLYQNVNKALRDNDLTKMETLGPFCFLMYDYIGRQQTDNVSRLHRLYQALHLKKKNPMVVYRGDTVSTKKLNEYRQAAGNKKKYFRWLCFVSTSKDINVAIDFGRNVLYEIDLGRYEWNDQFADISSLSPFETESEILLRPGVRFCVDNVERQPMTDRTIVFVHVLPSYISTV